MNFEFKYEIPGRQLIARSCQDGFGGVVLKPSRRATSCESFLGFGVFGKFGKVYLHKCSDTITLHHIQNVNDDHFH